jgi:hypothetical protein
MPVSKRIGPHPFNKPLIVIGAKRPPKDAHLTELESRKTGCSEDQQCAQGQRTKPL